MNAHIKYASFGHLGELVGNPAADRIIAVATSLVFRDPSLTQLFWGVNAAHLDSGFQGHMYTRPNDTLVVQVPEVTEGVVEKVLVAVRLNTAIWRNLTGIKLLPATGQIILASYGRNFLRRSLPRNIVCYSGAMVDSAVARYLTTDDALLAAVLDERVVRKLANGHHSLDSFREQATTTGLMMDKNSAMKLLIAKGIHCADTFWVNDETGVEQILQKIPADGRYVFKPSGGAAGVGLYSNGGRGASRKMIRLHLEKLQSEQKLPSRFQIQEFIDGSPYGVTASLSGNGEYKIFEVHQQLVSRAGRFTGGRWSPVIQKEKSTLVHFLLSRLAEMTTPQLTGLLSLDFIGDKIIETNPRMTAAAPISHILQAKWQFENYLGTAFHIEQIDLNTNVPIDFTLVQSGRLRTLIEQIWKEFRTLILPQGINPFGSSRIVVINDDESGAAQRQFLATVISEK